MEGGKSVGRTLTKGACLLTEREGLAVRHRGLLLREGERNKAGSALREDVVDVKRE